MLVSALIDNVRRRIRDPHGFEFTDADLIELTNAVLQQVYDTLIDMESNLVYEQGTITTFANVRKYQPSFDINGLLQGAVWIDEGSPLELAYEADISMQDVSTLKSDTGALILDGTGTPIVDGSGNFVAAPGTSEVIASDPAQPTHYFLSGNYMGFYPVPDKAYHINAFTWSSPETVSGTGESLPYQGLWDLAVERAVTLECMVIQERDSSRQALMSRDAWDSAVTKTNIRGCRPRHYRGMYL